MNRRTGSQATAGAGAGELHAQTIGLHCDLIVDPARENEMINHFHTVFVPAGRTFEGFIDVKLLKLRTTIQGAPPAAGVNYRFQLTYESEELRQKWVNSDTHTKVWAGLAATMKNPKDFQVLLFDSV
jgi:heme-degrading monooxygenase HmoA